MKHLQYIFLYQFSIHMGLVSVDNPNTVLFCAAIFTRKTLKINFEISFSLLLIIMLSQWWMCWLV